MKKRPSSYVLFLVVMALLALLGAALVIHGSATHTPPKPLFPGEWPMTRGLPL